MISISDFFLHISTRLAVILSDFSCHSATLTLRMSLDELQSSLMSFERMMFAEFYVPCKYAYYFEWLSQSLTISQVSGTVVLTYDSFLMFPLEVQLVWKPLYSSLCNSKAKSPFQASHSAKTSVMYLRLLELLTRYIMVATGITYSLCELAYEIIQS